MRRFDRYFFIMLTIFGVFGIHWYITRPSRMAAINFKPPGAMLNLGEVVEIAKMEGKRNGVDLGDFKKPVANFEFGRKGDETWVVFFEGRSSFLGNHFTVYVNDKTKEPTFYGGR
jgi:hypothetical protein